ncbi:uncharacterized protein K460DRAFT_412336 [Cucurbitaria berberidis CBS 394.84]|uniref:DUF7730 domain-containing protein n=1 Tax=Cucurbitaria berberidis CBS 394.84 TaxID=1168544 RepID=A0A9P4GSW3_9PLEO|nr:uncharacterized protein K460DRAFT_412336 [Cucurbitaria berberidis CBS 394.84]KAF1850674.1 hypothetical protein K460DRAFT_412336 [Cucurbitaria berberidis CBS 394.84]
MTPQPKNRAAMKGPSKIQADAIYLRNQVESPFLRLPGEIRNRIYEFALTASRIQVRKRYILPPNRTIYLYFDTCKTIKMNDNRPSNNVNLLLGITATCRQVHAEAALLPYTLNTFAIDPAALGELIKILPDHAKDAIKVVRLALSWESLLAGYRVKGLEHLVKLTSLEKIILPIKGIPAQFYPNMKEIEHTAQCIEIVEP